MRYFKIFHKNKYLVFAVLLTFTIKPLSAQTIDTISVFPNPFASTTTIHFNLTNTDTIALTIFNNLGQPVAAVFQAVVLPSGTYNINFKGDSLPDGMYFIALKIGSAKTLMAKAIKIGLVASINAPNSWGILKIYPNPTTDLLNIPLEGTKTIILSAVSGKIVKSITTDQQTISLSDIAAGQYVLTVLSNNNEIITTQKIVKTN